MSAFFMGLMEEGGPVIWRPSAVVGSASGWTVNNAANAYAAVNETSIDDDSKIHAYLNSIVFQLTGAAPASIGGGLLRVRAACVNSAGTLTAAGSNARARCSLNGTIYINLTTVGSTWVTLEATLSQSQAEGLNLSDLRLSLSAASGSSTKRIAYSFAELILYP